MRIHREAEGGAAVGPNGGAGWLSGDATGGSASPPDPIGVANARSHIFPCLPTWDSWNHGDIDWPTRLSYDALIGRWLSYQFPEN